mgnify:FL=1
MQKPILGLHLAEEDSKTTASPHNQLKHTDLKANAELIPERPGGRDDTTAASFRIKTFKETSNGVSAWTSPSNKDSIISFRTAFSNPAPKDAVLSQPELDQKDGSSNPTKGFLKSPNVIRRNRSVTEKPKLNIISEGNSEGLLRKPSRTTEEDRTQEKKMELTKRQENTPLDHSFGLDMKMTEEAIIKAFGANTCEGIVRRYNEDKVSIVLDIKKPMNLPVKWPKCSFFGVYDGHGGSSCADFLKDNLYKFVILSTLQGEFI